MFLKKLLISANGKADYSNEKSNRCLRKLSFIILVSLILIILLESEKLYNLRSSLALIVPFFNGKRELLSNIFLGIFPNLFSYV